MGEIIPFPTPELKLGLKPKITPAPTRVTPAPAPSLVNPYVRPQRSTTCMACAQHPRAAGSRYCSHCRAAGMDSPIINCRQEGCTDVGKRQYVGQQWFWCPKHHPGKTS